MSEDRFAELFYPEERIALFIDGPNLYQTARGLGFDIDYKRLRAAFADKARLVRALYYTAILEDQEYSPIRPLVDWLGYNGYSLVTKPLKEIGQVNGKRRFKGDMAVDLAVDAMLLADRLDHAVLFSGDGDFRPLVEGLGRKGVRTTVVSTMRSQPPMCSDDLRRHADQFLDLGEIESLIARDGPPRERDAGVRATLGVSADER